MKKFLLLSLMAIGLLATPKAAAITVDDLDGKICAQYFCGEAIQYGLPCASYSGKFRKINNNTLAIDYFLGAYTIDNITLANNRLSINLGSSQYIKDFYDTDRGSYYSLNIYPVRLGNQFQQGVYYYAGYAIGGSYTLNLDYKEDDLGGYFDIRGTYISAEEYEGIYEINTNVYNGFFLRVIEPNSQVFEDGDAYMGYFDVNGNTISFMDFLNLGIAYQNNNPLTSSRGFTIKETLSATLNSNGDFSIPAQKIGGGIPLEYIGYGTLVQGYTVGYWYGSQRNQHVDLYIGANGKTGDIKGHLTRDTYFHLAEDNLWAQDGNNTKGAGLITHFGDVVEFDKVSVYRDDLGVIGTTNTLTYFKPSQDYTHSVALENVKFGYGHINNDVDNYLYVEGDIVPGENADHVESYELYMIPGAYSSVSGSAFNNADKGHTQGFCLEGFDYNGWNKVNPTSVTVEENADENGKIHFQRVVPENTLKENSAFNNNNSYSFYVKTNYSAESGLESTFHALTPFNNTTTGVEDIIDNGELNDEDAPVMFYNMNGVLMDGNNLTPGLYIRRQGSSTSKVIIR